MKLNNKINFFLVACLVVALFFLYGVNAQAGNDDCDHPRFQEIGCTYPGDGVGQDGADGADGQDGESIVGPQGAQGLQGVQGIPGIVPEEWLTTTNTSIENNYNIVNKWRRELQDVAAAQSAMQVYLPQDQKSRLTTGLSQVSGQTGIGLGYAYMVDDERNTAVTVAVGHAGSETVVQGSIGFEFGGSRKIELPAKAIRLESITPTALSVASSEDYEEDIEILQMEQRSLEGQVASLQAQLNAPKPEPEPVVQTVRVIEQHIDAKRAADVWAALQKGK